MHLSIFPQSLLFLLLSSRHLTLIRLLILAFCRAELDIVLHFAIVSEQNREYAGSANNGILPLAA